MILDLPKHDRLRLLRFVCSFAWADLSIQDEEREFVAQLIKAFDLSQEERDQVYEWLAHPPAPEDVDPMDVPLEHRQIFLNAAIRVIKSDGVVDDREAENLSLFEMLLQ